MPIRSLKELEGDKDFKEDDDSESPDPMEDFVQQVDAGAALRPRWSCRQSNRSLDDNSIHPAPDVPRYEKLVAELAPQIAKMKDELKFDMKPISSMVRTNFTMSLF